MTNPHEDISSTTSYPYGYQKTEPLVQRDGQSEQQEQQDPTRMTVSYGRSTAEPAAAHTAPVNESQPYTPRQTSPLQDLEDLEELVNTAEQEEQTQQQEPLKMRKSARFEFEPGADVGVRIRWTLAGECKELNAQLCDISGTGFRFLSDDPIPADRELDVALLAPAPELNLRARACWSRPEASGQWCTGCRLEIEFPVEVFSEMGARGQINRRRETRKPVNIPALVSFELDSQSEVVADIIDTSQGGLCIALPGEYELGTRILVRVLSDKNCRAVPLIIRWNTIEDGIAIVGGSFLNRAGYDNFMASLDKENRQTEESPAVKPPERKRKRKRRLLRRALTSLALIACTAGAIFVYRGSLSSEVAPANIAGVRAKAGNKPGNRSKFKPARKKTADAGAAPRAQTTIKDTLPEVVATPAALSPPEVANVSDGATSRVAMLPPVASGAPSADALAEHALTDYTTAKHPAEASAASTASPAAESSPAPVEQPPAEQAPAEQPPVEQAAVEQPPVEQAAAAPARPEVVFHNPASNGGAVAFLWQGGVVSLPPGATLALPHSATAVIQWDRGGEYGEERRELEPRRYEFSVSPATGWMLETPE